MTLLPNSEDALNENKLQAITKRSLTVSTIELRKEYAKFRDSLILSASIISLLHPLTGLTVIFHRSLQETVIRPSILSLCSLTLRTSSLPIMTTSLLTRISTRLNPDSEAGRKLKMKSLKWPPLLTQTHSVKIITPKAAHLLSPSLTASIKPFRAMVELWLPEELTASTPKKLKITGSSSSTTLQGSALTQIWPEN